MDIYDELVRLRALGQKCALATIVEVNGSIPSFESAKILVREDGSFIGTIGGGCVEAEVWNAARDVIETERPRHLIQPGAGCGLRRRPDLRRTIEHVCRTLIPQPRRSSSAAGMCRRAISKIAVIAGSRL